MTFFIEISTLLVALFILYLLFQFLKNPLLIISNSIAGLAILFILNMLYDLSVPINIWTILTVGFGGLLGLFIVLLLHYLGVAF